MRRILFACVMLLCFPAFAQEASFDKEKPLSFAVQRVDVAMLYDTPADPAQIEKMTPVSLEQQVRRWANRTLVATGTERVMRVEITKASIREEFFQNEKHLFGLLGGEKMTRYTLELAVDFKIYPPGKALPEASVSVKVEQGGAQPSDTSIAGHESFIAGLSDRMMEDFNRQARESMGRFMASYLQ
jgi:hypothetical protein